MYMVGGWHMLRTPWPRTEGLSEGQTRQRHVSSGLLAGEVALRRTFLIQDLFTFRCAQRPMDPSPRVSVKANGSTETPAISTTVGLWMAVQ